MTPTVFLYVALLTALIAGAAAAGEWATRGRMPARHLWSAAIVAALVVPATALVWAARTSHDADARAVASVRPMLTRSGRAIATVDQVPATPLSRLRALLAHDVSWPHVLDDANGSVARTAAALWLYASLLLCAWITMGAWRWRRARRAWYETTLDGVIVNVSPATGPAVLGIVSQRIVLPAWATEMPVEQRRLVLAHECEHIAARDPQRLAVAAIALVVMPWNAALWWCVARLRRAIELDCDARVLRRFPDAKAYGYLLLDVARRGRDSGALAIPLVGLLRVPSELELRLRAIAHPRSMPRRVLVSGAAAALIAVAAAFTTPVPRVDGRGMYVQAGDTIPKTRSDSVAALRRKRDSLAVLERELVARRAAQAAARATLDSTTTALRAKNEQLRTLRQELMQQPAGPPNTTITYFDFQVDTPALPTSDSPAPRYPDELKAAKVSGEVDVQFVVDATGAVDMSTVHVVRATDPAFASAVRTALPRMRFTPARVGTVAVRQLVQQPFMFNTVGGAVEKR